MLVASFIAVVKEVNAYQLLADCEVVGKALLETDEYHALLRFDVKVDEVWKQESAVRCETIAH